MSEYLLTLSVHQSSLSCNLPRIYLQSKISLSRPALVSKRTRPRRRRRGKEPDGDGDIRFTVEITSCLCASLPLITWDEDITRQSQAFLPRLSLSLSLPLLPRSGESGRTNRFAFRCLIFHRLFIIVTRRGHHSSAYSIGVLVTCNDSSVRPRRTVY